MRFRSNLQNWCPSVKPIFHLATSLGRREAKARIRQRDWLTLVGEKIRREQVGTVPTLFSVRANKFAKWKAGSTVRKDSRAENSCLTHMIKNGNSC